MRISFTIPGPPRGKLRAQTAPGHSRPYDPPENIEREAEIARLFRVAAGGRALTAGPVRIDLRSIHPFSDSTFSRAVQRAAEECRVFHIGVPDLDNIEKLVKDALKGLAWRDDGQVAVVTKSKRYGRPARVEVIVTHLPQQADEITPGQRALELRVQREGWDAVLAQEDAGSNRSKARRRERRRGRS